MSLHLIVGPMWAGKSSELRRHVLRARAADRSVVVIKHDKDMRYTSDGKLTTHDQLTVEAELASRLAPIAEWAAGHDLVVVEEVQFFADVEDVVAFVRVVLAAGRQLVMAGLDGTYERQPWPVTSALFPLARRVEKLLAVCMRCKKADAAYTAYRGPRPGSVVNPGIRGYQACCEACWTPPEYLVDQ